MRKKRIFGIIISLLFVVGVVFVIFAKQGYFRNNGIVLAKFSRFINGDENTFSISVHGLKKMDIKIYWVNEGNDEIGENLLYGDKKFYNVFYDSYGSNKCYVYYKDKLISKGGHWKYRQKQSHDYNFIITNNTDSIITTVIISGPDSASYKSVYYIDLDSIKQID